MWVQGLAQIVQYILCDPERGRGGRFAVLGVKQTIHHLSDLSNISIIQIGQLLHKQHAPEIIILLHGQLTLRVLLIIRRPS